MNKFLITICLIFCPLSYSCTKQTLQATSQVTNQAYLTISFGETTTKATGSYEDYDDEIKSLYLYIFDNDTETLEELHIATTAELTLKKIVLKHTIGTKHIHLLANTATEDDNTLKSIKSLDELRASAYNLKNFDANKISMSGSQSNITLVESIESNATISLERNAARINLKEVINEYEKPFTIDSIYFLDATPHASYYDCSTVQLIEPYDRMTEGFNFQNYDIITGGKLIESGTTFSDIQPKGTHYFLFENTSSVNPTSLVITGTIEGTRVYYSTALVGSSSIMHNNHYDITIYITDMGTSSPEIDIFGCNALVTVSDWQEISNDVIF
ncbi:MAG: fimbrial protein [Rikenellaceae bacterium]